MKIHKYILPIFLSLMFLFAVSRVNAQLFPPYQSPTPRSTATPTLTPTATPVIVGTNIANTADITVPSAYSWITSGKTRLVDGDYNTVFESYTRAPVKINFNLKAKKTISAVVIVVKQQIANPTTHNILMGDAANPTQVYKTFNETTVTGTKLIYVPDKPVENIQYVTIELAKSYYTGAWKEIEIYEAPAISSTPTLTLTPSATLTPSPTATPTSTPSPTLTQSPACVCNTDNTCDSSCVYETAPCPEGATCPTPQLKCSRESGLGPTPGSEAKNGYCKSTKRTIGDADGNGTVDTVDYLYYVRAVNGGQIPETVNPDFNGDGYVSASDRAIVIATLGQSPSVTPSVTGTSTNTPTITPSPTQGTARTTDNGCDAGSACVTTQECFASGGIPSGTACSADIGKFCCTPQ